MANFHPIQHPMQHHNHGSYYDTFSKRAIEPDDLYNSVIESFFVTLTVAVIYQCEELSHSDSEVLRKPLKF